MDNRCPSCGKDLGRRKLAYSIVARMDVDCPHCRQGLRMNVHRLETALVLIGVLVTVALAAVSYVLGSQPLLLAALGTGLGAAAANRLLERTWLRRWPRYAARKPRPGME